MKQYAQHPPKWADRFLEWFCDEYLLEEIQGDLHEAFYHHLKTRGPTYAKRQYIYDVTRFFKPYAFEKYSRAKQFLPMFNNYFKIAIRNIWHRKVFTTLNLAGLSVGISAILLIFFYLRNEYTYDQDTPDHQQVYRLMNEYRVQMYTCMSFVDYYGTAPEDQLQLINHLKGYDGVVQACHFVPSESDIGGRDQFYVKVDGREFIADNVLYTNTGTAFNDIFPQEYLLGSVENAFDQFQSVVLTKSLAEAWFGKSWKEQPLLGKTLEVRGELYSLSAVVDDVPPNRHYDFDWIVYQKAIPSWAAYTYFKLEPQQSIDRLMTQLNNDVDKVYPGRSEDVLQKGIHHVALADIHFTPDTLYELKPVANTIYLKTFGIVGLIILLIILTNYTNLSIAMYADRQKELGVRKVMGAQSADISFQLLAEAILLALLCFPVCLLLLSIILPAFFETMGLDLDRSVLWEPSSLGILLGFLLLTGFLSGVYPALVYGRKSMLSLFGGKLSKVFGNRIFNLRNMLIASQFILVIGLMSVTVYIYQQLDFVKNKNLGFTKEGVLFFDIDGAEKYQQLRTALASIPEIKGVGANGIPGSDMYNQSTYKMKDTDVTLSDGTDQYVDYNLLKALNIACEACEELEKGKEEVFVINRTAAEKLAKIKGVQPEDLIGEVLVSEPEWENEEFGYGVPHVIDGIVDDYKFFSLKYPNQSLLISVAKEPGWAYQALVSANTEDWPQTISKIQHAYLEVEKERPFQFQFLEDRLDQLYIAEKRSGTLIGGLSFLAMLLALMGLAGMVSYLAYSRQKEIGIRKVLGASISSILFGFNKEFIQLLLLSTLVAGPLAILFASQWLSSFAFRIEPQIWVILGAGLFSAMLVILLVSLQSYRAASQQPVDVLKTD